MAELSRFFGIVVGMFYREHGPPHYHAVYGEFEVTVQIHSGAVSQQFPRRALHHLVKWHKLHQEELLENWKLAQERKPLRKISPLE